MTYRRWARIALGYLSLLSLFAVLPIAIIAISPRLTTANAG